MLIAVGGEDIHLSTGYEAPIDAGVRRVRIRQSRQQLYAVVLEGAGVRERQAVSMWGERDLRVVFGIADDSLASLITFLTILPIVGSSAAGAKQDKCNKS